MDEYYENGIRIGYESTDLFGNKVIRNSSGDVVAYRTTDWLGNNVVRTTSGG